MSLTDSEVDTLEVQSQLKMKSPTVAFLQLGPASLCTQSQDRTEQTQWAVEGMQPSGCFLSLCKKSKAPAVRSREVQDLLEFLNNWVGCRVP